jgi:hypothetical protein
MVAMGTKSISVKFLPNALMTQKPYKRAVSVTSLNEHPVAIACPPPGDAARRPPGCGVPGRRALMLISAFVTAAARGGVAGKKERTALAARR